MSAHGDNSVHRAYVLEAERDLLRAECEAKDALIFQLRRDLAATRLELVRRARGLILCPDDGPVLDRWVSGPSDEG